MLQIKGSNVTVMVHDMDMAISFYENIGMTLKQRWGNHYAMMIAQGITIGLHPTEKPAPNSGSVSIGFMIDSIEEAKILLDKNAISYRYEEDENSGLYLHFTDDYGTILYFVKPTWS